jgi:hypothetical protein
MAKRPNRSQSENRMAAEAREAAKRTQELAAAGMRRRRILISSSVAAAIVLILGGVALAIALKPKDIVTTDAGPANMASWGIAFTGGDGEISAVRTEATAATASPTVTPWTGDDADKKHVQLYLDWACPACKAFEGDNAKLLTDAVASGEITLELFPLAVVDRAYTTDYATRGANAAACVADIAPDSFLDVQERMFAAQPAEGTAGLSNEDMIRIIGEAGVTDPKLASCITDGTYRGWVEAATNRVAKDESLRTTIQGRTAFYTPTLATDGKPWDREGTVEDYLAR